MVVVQVLAFGRVQDNRVQRKDRRAAKAERERTRREADGVVESRDVKPVGFDGALDSIDEGISFHVPMKGKVNGVANGATIPTETSKTAIQTDGLVPESEASLTETSEEEMMI